MSTKLEHGIKTLVDAIAVLRDIRKNVAGLGGLEARLKESLTYLKEHNEEYVLKKK